MFELSKPILYITIGIPGAGKTTWSKTYLEAERISKDDIKNYTDLDETYLDLIANNLKTGKDTIADSMQNTPLQRNSLISGLSKRGLNIDDYFIMFMCFDIPLDVCKKRNAGREPSEQVGDIIIDMCYKQLIFPTLYELQEYPNCIDIIIIKEDSAYV